MGLAAWWRARARAKHRAAAVAEWRSQWSAAVLAPAPGVVEPLRAALPALGDDDERDIEEEMLAGLEALVELTAALRAGTLQPAVTGHRAAGRDVCYFAAPAELVDGGSGTLLLTAARAVFAAGGRTVAIPWHALAAVLRDERSLILVRTGRDDRITIRCNSYVDALRAWALAERFGRTRHV
jgi:hypothetical protein